jgi:myo-inositol-1(or 4)-monophosphatase
LLLDFNREMDVAVLAAHKAGGLLRMHFERGVQAHTKSTQFDLVTEADKASETTILAVLTEAFPNHRILSEEGGGNHAESEYVWLVDPLDGTTNFAHGHPQFCVSIALQHAGGTVAGVVYNVMRDELFTAARGAGARLNGRPIRVSHTPTLTRSLLATGFPYDRQSDPQNNLDQFGDLLLRAQGVLHGGSAAIDLATLAAGQLDGYWEFKLKPWDLAAGAILVDEAGGSVTNPQGAALDLWTGNVVASNGHIHGEMLAHLCQV